MTTMKNPAQENEETQAAEAHPSEATLAAHEFAHWVQRHSAALTEGEPYEVHPCRQVRGFMLRLPGVGWRMWYPTVADAVDFVRRLAQVHAADCFVYDSAGQLTD